MTKVSVYPNPANEYIHFKSENTNAKTVEIVDLNGKLVASEEFKDKAVLFSTDNLTNGLFIYLIKDKISKASAAMASEIDINYKSQPDK